MAYASGNVITDTDYNALVSDVNEVFGDINNGSVIEGAASFGYGQTELATNVSNGTLITADHWTALFESIQNCATHQGTSFGSLPTSVTTGTEMLAFDGVGGLLDVISNIRTNKLVVDAGQTTTTSSGTRLQSERTTAWTNELVHEFTADFATYNDARYFFNSGGQIRLSADRVGGSASVQNTNWSATLVDWSIVTFDISQTTGTGGGAPSAIGFYDLTGSYQTIFTLQGGAYAGDSTTLEAKMTGGLGADSAVTFKWTFTSEPSPDVIDGTLTTYIDDRRATGVGVTIAVPTYNTVVGLASGT